MWRHPIRFLHGPEDQWEYAGKYIISRILMLWENLYSNDLMYF